MDDVDVEARQDVDFAFALDQEAKRCFDARGWRHFPLGELLIGFLGERNSMWVLPAESETATLNTIGSVSFRFCSTSIIVLVAVPGDRSVVRGRRHRQILPHVHR